MVCTDNLWPDNEDFMLAGYIKESLTNKEADFNHIKKHLENHPCAYRFLKKPITPSGPKDFYMALEIDRFNFILEAKQKGSFIFLNKLAV